MFSVLTVTLGLPPQPQLDWQEVKPTEKKSKKKAKKGNGLSASLDPYSIRAVPASAAAKEEGRTHQGGVNKE